MKKRWTKARRAKFADTIRRRNNKEPEFIFYRNTLYRRVPGAGITRVK